MNSNKKLLLNIIYILVLVAILTMLIFKTIIAFSATKKPEKIRSVQKLEVPVVKQYPELPTGCEPTALTSILMYYGYAIEKTDLVDKYLIFSKTGRVKDGFVGNPYKKYGAWCFANTITNTANKFLKHMEDPIYKAYDISGASKDDLYKIVNDGNPVIVWTSMGNMYPKRIDLSRYKKGNYQYYDTEHCVVLSGYNKKKNVVYVMDPMYGNMTYNATRFFKIYSMTGKYSSMIIDKDSKIKKWLVKKFNLEKKKPKKK